MNGLYNASCEILMCPFHSGFAATLLGLIITLGFFFYYSIFFLSLLHRWRQTTFCFLFICKCYSAEFVNLQNNLIILRLLIARSGYANCIYSKMNMICWCTHNNCMVHVNNYLGIISLKVMKPVSIIFHNYINGNVILYYRQFLKGQFNNYVYILFAKFRGKSRYLGSKRS